MKAFGTRIQIKPEQKESVIRTPDANLVERGEVISIGDEVKHVKIGDKLLFTSFGVDSVDIDGTRHYFLLEDSAFILATE